MNYLQKLDVLAKEMKNGRVTEDQLNEYKLLVCQQTIVGQGITSGEMLLNREKAELIAIIDAIGTTVFHPGWTPQPAEIEGTINEDYESLN